MTTLTWDQLGERRYEAGVDRGVLYVPNSQGDYVNGYAWNGLTNVTETPSGAEPSAQWADNLKYLTLYSAEEFGATVEAYTYPREFAVLDGTANPASGVYLGQQNRGTFGLSYRTLMGNDLVGEAYGYKLHLAYGCTASPSEKSYATMNDSPEALQFSWEVTTVPVIVPGYKPVSLLTIESPDADPTALAQLEAFLWGTPGTDPSLPTPAEVVALFEGTAVEVTPTEPAFNGTDTITIPSVTGVRYYIQGVEQSAGAVVIAEDTVVYARPAQGYVFPTVVDDDWLYEYSV